MTKAELVARMAEEAGISKKAASKTLNALIRSVHESLKKKGGRIRIADLGTFKVVKRKARVGVNPRTGVAIKIPATTSPRFVPAKALKASAGLSGRPTTDPDKKKEVKK